MKILFCLSNVICVTANAKLSNVLRCLLLLICHSQGAVNALGNEYKNKFVWFDVGWTARFNFHLFFSF